MKLSPFENLIGNCNICKLKTSKNKYEFWEKVGSTGVVYACEDCYKKIKLYKKSLKQ